MSASTPPYKVVNPNAMGTFLFTAEHASCALPCAQSETEAQVVQTHWGWDIGIAPLFERVCSTLACRGVEGQVSRLWIDTNRGPDQEGLIKEVVEGVTLSFNREVSPEMKAERIASVHEPYHQAISTAIQAHERAPLLVSLHSFTPIWNQRLRSMDIGVLFDRDERLAHALAGLLEDEGFFVALNEPYSGKNDLIYSAHRHGTERTIPYVELEFNQSILSSPRRVMSVASRLSHVLTRFSDTYCEGGRWAMG